MSRALTQIISDSITNRDIKMTYVFEINDVVYTSLVISYNISFDKNFGSASATVTLDNNNSAFSSGGANEIQIGDKIELIENFTDDSSNWKSFYGEVVQRSINKNSTNRTITITCLDYINKLKNYDIDLEVEGTKVEVEDEILSPEFLASPNNTMCQVLNFANEAIASDPVPSIRIYDRYNSTYDPQYDGYQMFYSNGQLKLGSPLNIYDATDNTDGYYDIYSTYTYYTHGAFAEDILEEIITQTDGYSNFLFGEASAQDVIDNHLTTTYEAEEGTGETDTLTSNLTASTITIETTLASAVTAGDTSISIDSSSGFPSSGTGSINGDVFTWTGIDSGDVLTGIPATGTNSLKAHNSGDYVEYETEYAVGQVWSLGYSNLVTDLVAGDFTIPSGSTIDYVDKRYGRIILNAGISVLSSLVCDNNYSFKTLQATGIELNSIKFKPREIDNAFAAIEKLRSYLAPNFIIRTQGDDKIWASYLRQKSTEDYTLNLIQKIDYMEDEDLYTRTKFYGKNSEPTNLMYDPTITFVTSNLNYKATAVDNTLTYDREEGNFYVFKSSISDAGYLDQELEDGSGNVQKPIIKVNGVAIDDNLHEQTAMPVQITKHTRQETRSGYHGTWPFGHPYTKISSYYWYEVILPHMSIEPAQPVIFYNANGVEVLTVAAQGGGMSYGSGVYHVGERDGPNSTIESISTATYWVFYSTDDLEIKYGSASDPGFEFRIKKSLIPEREKASVSGTYVYYATTTPVGGIESIIDGKWNTQVQTEFFGSPPSGYHYSTIDMQEVKTIQAIDIIGGFYKPDQYRKFDVGMNLTLQYSTDGSNYYEIGDKTHNFKLSGGSSISFEEEELGTSFQARYLKIILEDVEKLSYGDGVWVVAISELAAYDDIIVKAEVTLISTTVLTQNVTASDTTIHVSSTAGFTEPESAEEHTAYMDKDTNKSFTYTGITATTFTGCTVESGISSIIDDYVTQTLETDTTLYDHLYLLPHLGDRLYKEIRINDENLYTQTQMDDISKSFLEEFVKEHTKLQTDIVFAPYIKVGSTIALTDNYNNISNVRYFVESVSNKGGFYNLVLARYPG